MNEAGARAPRSMNERTRGAARGGGAQNPERIGSEERSAGFCFVTPSARTRTGHASLVSRLRPPAGAPPCPGSARLRAPIALELGTRPPIEPTPTPPPPGSTGTAGASLSCSPQGISPGASRCAAEAHSARGWSWAPLNLGQCRAQFNRSAGMPCIEAGGSQWSLTLLSSPPPITPAVPRRKDGGRVAPPYLPSRVWVRPRCHRPQNSPFPAQGRRRKRRYNTQGGEGAFPGCLGADSAPHRSHADTQPHAELHGGHTRSAARGDGGTRV